MTYGIPHELIPLTADGKLKLKNHCELTEMRRLGDSLEEKGMKDGVVLPSNLDVLLGKGKPIQEHM